jgi:hypothetical protein
MHESTQARRVTRKLLGPVALHHEAKHHRIRIPLSNRLPAEAALILGGMRRICHDSIVSLLSNGSRLSCGAELKGSQTEC